jgi:hypothetical protein
MCPARRNVVRARLLIAVTLFTPADNGDTIITSIQQCVRCISAACSLMCLTRRV